MTPVPRRLVHTRSIGVEAYLRSDGLWDLVATVRDVKQRDIELQEKLLRAGAPLHDMELTVTVDTRMQVVDVQARTLAAPYPGACDSFAEVYRQLIGLNLLQGFRAAVRERVGGDRACTHITELAAVLPTAAIQAFSGEMPRPERGEGAMPLQLGRCRALRLDGPVVARHYARWFQDKKGSGTGAKERDDENP